MSRRHAPMGDAANPDLFEFTLTGADGAEHRYTVLPHNADEGIQISARILAASGDLLAAAIQQLLKGAAGAGGVSALLEGDAADAIQQIDVGALGPKASSVVLAVPGLVAPLLRHTTRDGAKLSDGSRLSLGGTAAYRANYGELYQALWKVVQYNGFLPLPGISG